MARKKQRRLDPFAPSSFLMLIIIQIVFILYFVGQFLLFVPFENNEYAELSDAEKRFVEYDFKAVQIGSETYKLYLADNDRRRTQGLTDVESMFNYEGMAFIFEKPAQQGFWMKGMHFPLDFVYVHNEVVVDIIEDVSPDSFPETFTPREAASIVIELNANQVEVNGVEIGDPIDL